MALPARLVASLALAALASVASAQVVTTGPFTGQHSDGFETQTAGQFTTCILGRVFGNTADLCDPQSNSAHITSGWGFMCSISPNSGTKLFGSGGGPAIYTFDQTVTRFGGFFGINSGVADAIVELYDANGTQLFSSQIAIPATCAWVWHGWQVVSGPPIKSIKVIGLNSFGGGYVMMDDMEVDYGTPCPPPVTYCTPKINSLGCTPSIAATGTSSAAASSGFVITASNLRNQKAGLLIYGITGRSAVPFSGGFLCIQPAVRRTPPKSSGGTALPTNDCSGVLSIDMNSQAQWLLGGGQPLPGLLVPGTLVRCQYWSSDPGFPPPNNVSLTQGLEYVVCP